MSAPLLNTALLKKFLKLASQQLQGDWILVGGTVLPLLERDYRSTTDIDLVPIGNSTTEQTLQLMTICDKLGLPIETINSAATYFVQKIPHFKDHLVLLSSGKTSQIFRPNASLFIELKLGRLSETDLSDCLEMLRLKGDEIQPPQLKKLLQRVKRLISEAPEPQVIRLRALLEALEIDV